ncbi:hypothetical protein SpCBS45565_g04033 [Spizellomyces sp. 'palustris']|nr:hypothetical protein SpCBS45565_g04033 [Spizellomyces sp. 'palustris']
MSNSPPELPTSRSNPTIPTFGSRPLVDFDARLEDAEKIAWGHGLIAGAVTLAITGGGFWYAKNYRHKNIPFYTAGVVTALATLVVSQVTIHSSYIVKRNEVIFEKRKEAAARVEAKRKEELALARGNKSQ